MKIKEKLIKEIEQTSDFILEEVFNFLLFLKVQIKQKTEKQENLELTLNPPEQSFLNMFDEISNQISKEENLDHYLYNVLELKEVKK